MVSNRVLDAMNETNRTGLNPSVQRPPPASSSGLFAVLILVAILAVTGMAAWFGRNVVRQSDRGQPLETAAIQAEQPKSAGEKPEEEPETGDVREPVRPAVPDENDRFLKARRDMVEHHFRRRDITDERVLEAMGRIPRHLYVPDDLQNSAYADRPLPIGRGQTISQPYIVALMTQLARPRADSRALDVGTGSGYQAAVLGELCKEVYSIEIVEWLAEQAAERLAEQGYENVDVRAGDGYQGWPEHAPFDLIIVAAAPDHVPEPLVEQLAPGGRMIIPVGRFQQDLMVIEKQEDGTVLRWSEIPVAFVPMTGEAQQPKQERE
jgi:protein-L-isoaspartate(D-aspartate) O-methyltransferase